MNRSKLKVLIVEPSREMRMVQVIVEECPSTEIQIDAVAALELQRRVEGSRAVIVGSRGDSHLVSVQSEENVEIWSHCTLPLTNYLTGKNRLEISPGLVFLVGSVVIEETADKSSTEPKFYFYFYNRNNYEAIFKYGPGSKMKRFTWETSWQIKADHSFCCCMELANNRPLLVGFTMTFVLN